MKLILLALCLSTVTFTISSTGIFEPVRKLLSKIHLKVEELIHCPFCLSHWVVIFFSFFFYNAIEPEPILGIYWFDFIVNAFAIICISAVIHFVLLRAYKPVGEAMMRRELERLEKEK